MRTTCREVAMALALGAKHDVAHDRHTVHLSSCPKCVAFERQLAFIDEAIRSSCVAFEQELSKDFESRIVRRLCS